MQTTEIKKRPILFSGEMVCAILDGRKTQTRRVIKPQPHKNVVEFLDLREDFKPVWTGSMDEHTQADNICIKCPYGRPGDRLWVKESWGVFDIDGYYNPNFETDYGIGYSYPDDECFWVKAPPGFREYKPDERMRPSIFMPRWASRITLEIADVRVERVGDISEGDALAEGLVGDSLIDFGIDATDNHAAVMDFGDLWDSINAKRGYGWDVNPWVWVITFKRVEGDT